MLCATQTVRVFYFETAFIHSLSLFKSNKSGWIQESRLANFKAILLVFLAKSWQTGPVFKLRSKNSSKNISMLVVRTSLRHGIRKPYLNLAPGEAWHGMAQLLFEMPILAVGIHWAHCIRSRFCLLLTATQFIIKKADRREMGVDEKWHAIPLGGRGSPCIVYKCRFLKLGHNNSCKKCC